MTWAAVRGMKPNKLRNVPKMAGPKDGTRTLVKSVMDRRVIAALDNWRWVASPDRR